MAIAVLVLPPERACHARSGAMRLLVQHGDLAPVRDRATAVRLADWLEQRLGRAVELDVSADALSHWLSVRNGSDHHVVFEEAHFLDYRVSRHDYRVIARSAGDARFAVVVAPGTLVSGLADLQARRMAVPSPPGLAALRVHQLFPDAGLAPVLVVPPRGQNVVTWVSEGRVAAAVIALGIEPPPEPVRAVIITDALPGPGVAVRPGLDAGTERALLRALIALGDAPGDADVLDGLRHGGFQPASDSVYEGASALLRGTWGYR